MLAAAVSLVGAAGLLQYRLSSGEKGLSAFLGREKKENPFYQDGYTSEVPETPEWMQRIRLPTLDFVEVYGQERRGSNGGSGDNGGGDDARALLYRQLDAALDAEEYEEAARLKRQIDDLLELGEGGAERPQSDGEG